MLYTQRGLDKRQEQKSSQLIRDTRTLYQKIYDWIIDPTILTTFIITAVATSFIYPWTAELVLLFILITGLITICRKNKLPFRMPKIADADDWNDLYPGGRKPRKARGIYYFGNDKKNQDELWFANEDMRTHVLIFGSTGSGKTEALISLAFNALMQASGFIYVDGKGDNSLFAKIFSMVKYMGREDDMLLINFMTGAKDISGPQETRISNTLNPFSEGSSSMLSNLVVSMMESSSSSGDGDMWKGRAIAFVEALMRVMVAMRDAGYILLDAHVIRNYFGLDRIEAMVLDKAFIRDDDYAINLEVFPENILEPMKAYLNTLPGFNKDRKGKQVSQVFEQHGFIVMQLTRIFSSLADTYGHIMRTKLAEVDLKDVVLNRRILIVLLPALEKSPDELSNLGKVVISTMKVMMASGLGEAVEGRYQDLITRKPTNAETPFLCILDEYGYYAVKGFAVVPAQARSLGFSVVFAGQDLPAFQKASKEEAASIGANTNIKICMKLEDPAETWEFFQKTAGESYVSQVESFQSNAATVTGTYQDTKGAKLEKRARIDLLDLKEQDVGEAHIFFKSNIIRARMFYANPPQTKSMRLNQMLKVDMPPDSALYVLVKGIEDFEVLVKQQQVPDLTAEMDSTVHQVIQLMDAEQHVSSLEKGLNVLVQSSEKASEVAHEAHEASDGTSYHIFKVAPAEQTFLLPANAATLDTPILDANLFKDDAAYVQRLLGDSEARAKEVTQSLQEDIMQSTFYGEQLMEAPTSDEYSQMMADLVQSIAGNVEAKDATESEENE